MSAKLSVAIITKDEGDRIAECLRSVAFADEVIVVDAHSTDDTVKIANFFGAKVFLETWRGFGAQKQFAVDQCRNEWVLILDADERLSKDSIAVIEQMIAHEESAIAAYSFKRRNYLYGRWVRHSGWWPDRVVRLVRKDKGQFSNRPVHEQWITSGPVRALGVCIEHYSFRCCSDIVAKMERYSTLGAEVLLQEGSKRSGAFTPGLCGIWTFFQTYFLQLGILDGFEGFLIAAMNAGGTFLKYAKLRELLKKDGSITNRPAPPVYLVYFIAACNLVQLLSINWCQ